MKVFQKTKMLTDAHLHYCPGCTHGIVHRLVAESIEELGLQDKCIGIAPVGCAVFAYDYFNCDMQEAAHGALPPSLRASSAPIPIRSSLSTKATATSLRSVWQRRSTPPRAEKR